MPRIKIIKTPKGLRKYQGAIGSSQVGNTTDETTIKFTTSSADDMMFPYADNTDGITQSQQSRFPVGDPRADITAFNKPDVEQQAYNQNPSMQLGIDAGLFGKQNKFGQRQQYTNFFNQKYNTNFATPVFGPKGQKFMNKAQKIGAGLKVGSDLLQQGLSLGSMYANKLESDRMREQARRKFMQQPVFAGNLDRGQYTSTGLFKPNQYTSNLGMYTNKLYPEINYTEYGGQMFAGGGAFESVIPEEVISNYSVSAPIITPSAPTEPMAIIPKESATVPSSGGTSKATKVGGGSKEISMSHNNPLNLHYGKFASKYGAEAGAPDTGGKVAIFPDLQTGIQANKDLLFGRSYNNLTVSQARNKWVSGTNIYNSSTRSIVQEMGGIDKKLSDLSNEEKDRLFKLFAKWEGKQGYNQIKSMSLFNNGGENRNTMKIRIVGTPGEETKMAAGGQPPYSGQSDYGLYIGQRNLYRSMPQNPYENPGKTVSEEEETSEDPYVLEAEGGETILRPDGTHMNISGKRHTEGGVKLTKDQAPEGSFIYSDTKKMKIKDPEVLKHFGKSGKAPKGGITPADLAKQYDINRYKAILANPNSDTMSKKTAQKMIETYQDKLAQLALVQEGMKGFPAGIPQVAQNFVNKIQQQQQPEMPPQAVPEAAYGGMFGYGGDMIPDDPDYAFGGGYPTYQNAGEIGEDIRKQAKPVKSKKAVPSDYSYVGKSGTSEYWKRTTPGQSGQSGKTVRQAVPGGVAGKAWENWIIDQLQNGVSIEELAAKGHGTVSGLQKYKNYYIPATSGTGDVTDYLVYDEQPRSRLITKQIPVPEQWPGSTTEQVAGPKAGQVVVPPAGRFRNRGRLPFFSYDMFVTPEQEKVGAAAARSVIPTPVFYDPTRALAENASLAKQFTQGYQGSVQGYSGAANAAQTKAAEQAANIIGAYADKNVGVGTEADKVRAAIMNQDIAQDAERRDKILFNTEQARKAYRSNLAKYLGKRGMLDRSNYDTRTKTGMLNAVNPYFNIGYGPGSAGIFFKPGVDAYSMITGQFNFPGQQKASTPNYKQYLDEINSLKTQYPNLSPSQLNMAYRMKNPGMGTSGTSGAANARAMQGFLAQAMGANNPYSASNPMYSQGGYDMSDLYDQYDQYPAQ